MGEVTSIKGEIPKITISEFRRARLTDGPVQTTQFSPQELSVNFSATGRRMQREGARVLGANGEMDACGKRWRKGNHRERKNRGKLRSPSTDG